MGPYQHFWLGPQKKIFPDFSPIRPFRTGITHFFSKIIFLPSTPYTRVLGGHPHGSVSTLLAWTPKKNFSRFFTRKALPHWNHTFFFENKFFTLDPLYEGPGRPPSWVRINTFGLDPKKKFFPIFHP